MDPWVFSQYADIKCFEKLQFEILLYRVGVQISNGINRYTVLFDVFNIGTAIWTLNNAVIFFIFFYTYIAK